MDELSGSWFQANTRANRSNQHRALRLPALVVDFSTGWLIATTGACIVSREDTALLRNLIPCRIAMLARALRFRWGKNM